MNCDIEYEIVKKYVKKNKQKRIIWEFSNSKKRRDVIWKFFAGPDIFKENCLHPIKYMSDSEMEQYLYQLSGSKNVYYIGEGYIGELLLKQAVKGANRGEICIIYCGDGIGYYQGEQEIGKPPRYLLM